NCQGVGLKTDVFESQGTAEDAASSDLDPARPCLDDNDAVVDRPAGRAPLECCGVEPRDRQTVSRDGADRRALSEPEHECRRSGARLERHVAAAALAA